MAVQRKMISAQEISDQIGSINEKMGYGQEALATSPTAYTADTLPSGSDLFSEINIRRLQKQKDDLQSQLLQKKWYGEGRAPEQTGGKRKEGLLEGALNMLSRPLHAIVGGVEAATGKGTVPGWANIQKNIEEKGTFGDLLRREGMNGGVAAPLGFVLDVAFDPVNWMTAGTGALLPRIGYGLAKAGIKGGLKGAESGFLQKAATISRLLPGKKAIETGVSGIIPETAEETGKNIAQKIGVGYEKTKGAYSTGVRGIQERAIQSSEEYNKLIGNELKNILDEKNNLAKQYLSAGDILKGAIEKLPYGESLFKAFDYNPKEWFKVQMLRDQLEEIEKKKGTFIGEKFDPITSKKIDPTSADIESAMEAAKLENLEDIFPKNPLGERTQNFQAEKISEIIDESTKAAKAPMTVMRDSDALSRAEKMLGEASVDYDFKDLVKVLNERISRKEASKTQIEWYDNLRKAANELKVLNGKPYVKKMLDTYDAAIGFFKASKVSALSPSAMMNATVGNLAMASMAGLNILRPQLFKNVKDSFLFLNGRGSSKFLKENIDSNPLLRPFFASHVNTFGGVMGMTPMDFMNRVNMETIINEAKKVGVELTPDQVQEGLLKANNAIKQTPLQYTEQMRKEGVLRPEATTLTTQELGSNEAYMRFKDWAAQNASSNPVAKILNFIMTKPVSVYEKIDQSYRLGNFIHMTNNGLEREEIIKLARFIQVESKDVANKYKSGGRYLYRVSPEKALEAVNMIYMNYAAMPGAVKVLRSLPIVGVPFASFGYGMGMKTIETAMYNPAVFNKINFLLNEISGPKTPLEKETMSRGFYEDFGQPGMVKLPFFRENPFYLNVANMLPYLSLNLFSEEGRKYGKRFPDKVAATIENMPLLKDPVGQIIFDYVIQPSLMRDVSPQTSFGSPLYPLDATATQKAGYAGRQLLEAFVPTGPGAVAGLAAGFTPLPESAIEMTPSYRFWSLARSVRGEDVFGQKRKEAAAARTARGISGTMGLPISQMNLDYTAKELTKKKK